MNLEPTWIDLEESAAATRDRPVLARRIVPDGRWDLMIGVTWPEQRRLFLVTIDAAAVQPMPDLPAARGFEVSLVHLPDQPLDRVSLQVTLLQKRYNDVFSALVSDVAGHVQTATNHKQAVKVCINRLLQWQHFLEHCSPEGLSEQAQCGLFGELWFLKNVLVPVVGDLQAIRAWVGPDQAVHDFRLATGSIEVKTTTSKEHTKLAIASEKQLDDSGVAALFVYHLPLSPAATGGLSLPDLVQQVRSAVEATPAAADALDEQLRRAGYLDTQSSRYQSSRWMPRGSHVFRVTDGFPRLTQRDIPSGVGDIHYTIALASCMPFAIETSELQSVLEGSGNGH